MCDRTEAGFHFIVTLRFQHIKTKLVCVWIHLKMEVFIPVLNGFYMKVDKTHTEVQDSINHTRGLIWRYSWCCTHKKWEELGFRGIYLHKWNAMSTTMFSLVYNHSKMCCWYPRINVLYLEKVHHVSTVAQTWQTKHRLGRGPPAFLATWGRKHT